MASLAGTQLKDTYESLLKLSDNDALTATYKEVTDGEGAGTNLYVGTGGNVGIGTSSPTNYTNFTTLAIGDSVQGGVLELQYNGAQAARIAAVNPNTITLSTNNTERLRAYSGGDISLRDTSNNEAFYWDASEASLGIGNTSPASFLSGANVAVDVGNSSGGEFVARRTGGEANLAMGVTGGNIGYLYSTTNTPMVFGTNNAERMRIDSDGNVGINNVSPTVPSSNATTLHINGSVSTKGGAVRLSSSNSSIDALLYPSSSQFYIGTISNHDLGFYTNNTPRLTIDTSGNVGIGTTSPKDTLDVVDGISVTDSNTALTTNTVLNGIDFYTSDPSFASRTSNRTARIVPISNDSVGQSFALGFYTASTDTDATERMRIDSDGNVGIGGSPSTFANYTNVSIKGGSSGSNLDFLNSSGTRVGAIVSNPSTNLIIETNEATPLVFKTNDNPAMTIDSSGRVGIGETNPDRELDLKNSADNCIMSITSSTSHLSGLVLGDTADDDRGGILYNNTSDFLYFLSNAQERLRILSGGGITFNGDTATANALDDYEEGTWDATIYEVDGNDVVSEPDANYVKIGSLVHIQVRSLGGTTGGAGIVRMNLPFTHTSKGGANIVAYSANNGSIVSVFCIDGTDYLEFVDTIGSISSGNKSIGSDWGSGSRLYFNFTYSTT